MASYAQAPNPAPAVQDIAESIEQRLSHAQAQAESKDGDCGPRLVSAQQDLDIIAANPALDMVVPVARARLADIGYRLHIARAYCGQATPRPEELRAALDAAQTAVPLYRGLYDYQSMAIMQYDVAIAYRLLGEQDKAVAALEEAIVLDGDYGFTADAEENNGLLGRWRNQPEPAAAAPIPKRSIALKFSWALADADVAVEADYSILAGGVPLHSKATVTALRQIRAHGTDWIAEYQSGDRHYDLDALSATPLKQAVATMAAEQLLTPDFLVSDEGEFHRAADPAKTADALIGDIETAAGGLPPAPERSFVREPTEMLGLSAQLLSLPKGVAFKAEQDFDITTSAWIGATLDQGVWYDMQASMMLPGMAVMMQHNIQFSYSRPVPCAEGVICAEILVHATPDPEALKKWLEGVRRPFKLTDQETAHYASAIDFRLVVDPDRLAPYVTEARSHWYLAFDGRGEPLIGSEKVVSTYRYH